MNYVALLAEVRSERRFGGKAHRKINVQIFEKTVLDIVQCLITEEEITKEQVRDVEHRAMSVAARVADDFAEAKLSTSLDYLGVPKEVKAKTSQHYVRLAIASVLKAAMVGKERGLVALSWEEELVATWRHQCKVANEIAEKHKLAMDAAIELVRDAETPEEMLDVIRAKRFSHQLDDTFILEQLLLEKWLGDWGRSALLGKFLESLSKSATLGDAEAKLQLLAKGDLRGSTSRATQGALGAWQQLIVCMAKGISPTAQAMRQDEAHRKMAQLLPQLLTFEVMNEDDTMAIVSGKEAVAGIIALLPKQGEPMNMELVSKAHTLAWLHTLEQA